MTRLFSLNSWMSKSRLNNSRTFSNESRNLPFTTCLTFSYWKEFMHSLNSSVPLDEEILSLPLRLCLLTSTLVEWTSSRETSSNSPFLRFYQLKLLKDRRLIPGRTLNFWRPPCHNPSRGEVFGMVHEFHL